MSIQIVNSTLVWENISLLIYWLAIFIFVLLLMLWSNRFTIGALKRDKNSFTFWSYNKAMMWNWPAFTILDHELESFTTSKTDHHLLHQKVRQRISVMKTNTGVFVVFKAKRELKYQFSRNIVCLFHYWDS